jgi:SAM-dependent methyltransferase
LIGKKRWVLKLIKYLYHSPLANIFPTAVRQLQKDLKDCRSVLDLGCGPSSPLEYVKTVEYSVGVEAYLPYVEKSKEKRIHTEYLTKYIMELDFPPNSFDAVILIGVLEHIEHEEGLKVLSLCEKWASKKVIVTTPNGFISQKSLDGNPLQVHLSGWKVDELRKLNYVVRGMCGFKFLRHEVDSDGMGDDLLVTMRFRPRFLWFVISVLTVPISFFFPKWSFDLYCIKRY